jgi:hypothetical protein
LYKSDIRHLHNRLNAKDSPGISLGNINANE